MAVHCLTDVEGIVTRSDPGNHLPVISNTRSWLPWVLPKKGSSSSSGSSSPPSEHRAQMRGVDSKLALRGLSDSQGSVSCFWATRAECWHGEILIVSWKSRSITVTFQGTRRLTSLRTSGHRGICELDELSFKDHRVYTFPFITETCPGHATSYTQIQV